MEAPYPPSLDTSTDSEEMVTLASAGTATLASAGTRSDNVAMTRGGEVPSRVPALLASSLLEAGGTQQLAVPAFTISSITSIPSGPDERVFEVWRCMGGKTLRLPAFTVEVPRLAKVEVPRLAKVEVLELATTPFTPASCNAFFPVPSHEGRGVPPSCCEDAQCASSPSHPPASLASNHPQPSLQPLSLFDSHCHLGWTAGKLGLPRPTSLQALVTIDPAVPWPAFAGCVATFCHPSEWRGGAGLALRQAAGEARVWVAVGCHPHFAAQCGPQALWGMEEAMAEVGPSLVAVGECGLDYSGRNMVPREQQVAVFRAQVRLARRLWLPLVLHIREAEQEGRRVLREEGLPREWPVHRHCFTGDAEEAASWLEEWPGSRLGVTAGATYSPTNRFPWLAGVPLAQLILETDAPYFPPRGAARQVALPGDVAHVAAAVAAVKGVSMEEVLAANLRSVRAVYGIRVGVNDEAVKGEVEGDIKRVTGMEEVKMRRTGSEELTVRLAGRQQVKMMEKMKAEKMSSSVPEERGVGEVEVVRAKLATWVT